MRSVALALVVAVVGAPSDSLGEEPAPARDRDEINSTAERVRSMVEEHVERTARESGGVYRVPDPRDGKVLDLELVGVSLVSSSSLWTVHDPHRRIEGQDFVACVTFHPAGRPKENLYDVDVLVERRAGALVITEVRVHKEKRLVDGRWIWEDLRKPPSGAAVERP